MSLFRSRAAGSVPDSRIAHGGGVPSGAPLAKVLELVAEGSATRAAAVAALKRDATTLELDDAVVNDATAQVLEELMAKTSAAKSLDLNKVKFEGASFTRICNGIAQNPHLVSVSITRSNLTDSQAEKLAAAIVMAKSPVATINLSYNALASPVVFLDKLKRDTHLEMLNLSGNALLCGETLAGAVAGHWPALSEVLLLRTSLSESDQKALREAAVAGSERFSAFAGPRSVSVS